MVRTHNDVIQMLGGPIAVALQLGQKADTVRRWRLRNNIPRSHWDSIVKAAKGRVTVAQLYQSAPPDRRVAA